MIGTPSGADAPASVLDLIATLLTRGPTAALFTREPATALPTREPGTALSTAERRPPPAERRRHSQLARVHGYIQGHLADPRLSPRTIATAHHISVRSLHRLFATEDTTVASWIRTQRLERCRHDLTDPALRDRPIHAIASRWGFPSHAHFTRAFRTAYGISPLEHRQARL